MVEASREERRGERTTLLTLAGCLIFGGGGGRACLVDDRGGKGGGEGLCTNKDGRVVFVFPFSFFHIGVVVRMERPRERGLVI